MRKSIVFDKSKAFTKRIIKLHQFLTSEKKEFIISKQILRSGTSIGANIAEGLQGQSRADFISKFSIALKEASETEYWFESLYKSNYLTERQLNSIKPDCIELIAPLLFPHQPSMKTCVEIINNWTNPLFGFYKACLVRTAVSLRTVDNSNFCIIA